MFMRVRAREKEDRYLGFLRVEFLPHAGHKMAETFDALAHVLHRLAPLPFQQLYKHTNKQTNKQ